MKNEVTLVVPTRFYTDYLQHEGIMTGEDEDEDALALKAAFDAARRIPFGRGYLLQVDVSSQTAALLHEYADYVADPDSGYQEKNHPLWRSATTLVTRLNDAQDTLSVAVGDDVEEPRVDYRNLSRGSRRACAAAVSRVIKEDTGLMPDSSRPAGYKMNELRVTGWESGVHVWMSTDEPRYYDTDATFRTIVEALRARGFLLIACTMEKLPEEERGTFIVIGKR